MKNIDKNTVTLWAKRLLIYFCGLFCIATGIAFSAKSGLGVSPVGSPANVLYQIGLSMGLPESFFNLGNWTIAVYCMYILSQILILGRSFKPVQLLQLAVSFAFGWLVNLTTAMVAGLPAPTNYGMQMLYLLVNVPMVALGVMLYLSPNLLPTPGEGVALAISERWNTSVATGKTIFDCSMVVISVIISLIYFHGLVGVREGTVICALCTGFVMRQFQKLLQKPLLRFVEREGRVDRYLEAAAEGYTTDATGKPKILIAIGREFGSGGYEIGKLLAEKLGITFYDQQLNEMAAEESGIPLAKVQEMEEHLVREALFDFKAGAYEMTGEGMSIEERLFVAQTTAIRKIAAGDESCVIMGRCADYTLYDDPNCFRIYIHALPLARTERLMNQFGLTEAEAKRQMQLTDASRRNHYRHFTGREYGKQEYYHLSVDSAMLGTDASVELIMECIRMWCDVRGTHPLSSL
ncbi:MAG: DUF6198 family protein [Oscillospiraceae bacterium]